jgi:Raf kinase inhibitor-like YbhB/YbcL family protein
VPTTARPEPDGIQGRNDFGTIGYRGPCPPRGPAHHYRFKLYALDEPVALPPGASKDELLQAMQGHVLGQTELVGTYQRRGQ